MSRQKQLITVFAVANAQKQGVMGARLVLASRTTMFQEERSRRTQRVLGGWTPLSVQNKRTPTRSVLLFWSGLRGSNPPPPPWQGGALPNELNPRKWCLRSESNQRHEDFQSSALPTELQRHIGWRLGWGSNPRPLA